MHKRFVCCVACLLVVDGFAKVREMKLDSPKLPTARKVVSRSIKAGADKRIPSAS